MRRFAISFLFVWGVFGGSYSAQAENVVYYLGFVKGNDRADSGLLESPALKQAFDQYAARVYELFFEVWGTGFAEAKRDFNKTEIGSHKFLSDQSLRTTSPVSLDGLAFAWISLDNVLVLPSRKSTGFWSFDIYFMFNFTMFSFKEQEVVYNRPMILPLEVDADPIPFDQAVDKMLTLFDAPCSDVKSEFKCKTSLFLSSIITSTAKKPRFIRAVNNLDNTQGQREKSLTQTVVSIDRINSSKNIDKQTHQGLRQIASYILTSRLAEKIFTIPDWMLEVGEQQILALLIARKHDFEQLTGYELITDENWKTGENKSAKIYALGNKFFPEATLEARLSLMLDQKFIRPSKDEDYLLDQHVAFDTSLQFHDLLDQDRIVITRGGKPKINASPYANKREGYVMNDKTIISDAVLFNTVFVGLKKWKDLQRIIDTKNEQTGEFVEGIYDFSATSQSF